MQFLHLLFLLPAAATCYILQQEPHNVHHLPAPPHLIQRRDRADYEAWKNPRPWNAHESKTNPNIPANIDHRQRAREDFLESTTREYGTKPSKLVNGRRPMKDTGPSKKRVAEARDNGRRKQENDRMSTEDQEIDQIVVGKPTPVLELGFGYNKGSKYDNGYGHLRAFDKSILDVGAVEALAAGMAENPEIEDYIKYEGSQG